MNFFVKIAKKGGIFVHRPPSDDVAGLPDVASGAQATGWRGKAVTWRAGPPRRYDVALRPRGRTRVAHARRACGADVWPGATRTDHADAHEGRHVAKGGLVSGGRTG